MPTRQKLELREIHSLRSFVVILIVLFTIESAVMHLLPYLVSSSSTVSYRAIIDAILLTGVVAPMIWMLIIKPLQRLAATRQRLLALHLTSQEIERRRISLELHDSLGQWLTVLTIGLRTIEESSSEKNVQLQTHELRRIGSTTHDELRRIVRGLRPVVLDDLGLIPALQRYVDDLCSLQCINAHLELGCNNTTVLGDDIQISVFRIVQEASNNALRHGNAKCIQVKLDCNETKLTVEIEDDGDGFDAASVLTAKQCDGNLGLLSIHERACLLGGEATISSSPGAGTRVRVDVPLGRKSEHDE